MQQTRDILSIGNTISVSSRDHYIVEAVLGKGGFSTIYLVRDRRVKQNLYALKEVIDPDKSDREHFTLECEILTHIEHPSLPRVYHVFEDDRSNRIYILMEYIEGPNLSQLRKQYYEQRLALSRVLNIMTPVVEAISFLHCQNPPIVHRDIKPANIVVPTSGEKAILVDFGSAKVYESEATTTAVRHCSPGYGAPEQYGIGTTPRTDIYGLGATVYTLLTGKVPVDALQRMVQFSEKGSDPLEPVQQIVPTLPDAVAEAIHRAMSLRRDARFATVEEFWQALSDGAAGQQSTGPISPVLLSRSQRETNPDLRAAGEAASPVLNKAHISSTTRRGRRLAILLILLSLLCGLGIGSIYWSSALGYFHPVATKTPVSTRATSSPSNPRPGSPTYPPLASQYSGTIGDVAIKSSSSMSLFNVQQQGKFIRGNFVGLGLAGTFAGTIDPGGHMLFKVTIYGGNEIIAFDGNVKLGGSIAGSFRALNRNQEFTGEFGIWNVAPA